MDAQEKQHMLDRLHAAVDTKAHAAPTLRQRLANGSRSGLAARMDRIN